MARDFYRLDNAENRYITELVGPAPADYSAFTGGGAFTNMYVTIRAANTLLDGLANASGMTAAEKSATAGFARTFKALSYYRVLESRDSLGIAIDVNHPIDAPAADFVCKPNALAAISALLDSAATDLAAAGSADFPFTLPSGFSLHGDFSTPAAFLKFNKGLKGKVELYRALSRQKPNAAAEPRRGARGAERLVPQPDGADEHRHLQHVHHGGGRRHQPAGRREHLPEPGGRLGHSGG